MEAEWLPRRHGYVTSILLHLNRCSRQKEDIFSLQPATKTDLLVRIEVVLSEEAPVLDEARLDVVVVHELREDVELLPQELVREVHLNNIHHVHDSHQVTKSVQCFVLRFGNEVDTRSTAVFLTKIFFVFGHTLHSVTGLLLWICCREMHEIIQKQNLC